MDLISVTVRPGEQPGREFCEDSGLFTWIEQFNVGICSALGAVIPPVTAIISPSPDSLRSDSISNFPHSRRRSYKMPSFLGSVTISVTDSGGEGR